MPNVACITGLYIIDCHFSFLTQKDDNQSKGTTQQTERKVNNKESRDTVNIGHKTSEDKQNKNTIQKTEVLFIIDCPFCLLCCSFAFIVVLLCVVFPMLPVSLDCLLLTFSSVCCVVPLL
jgi:hypothetical protein